MRRDGVTGRRNKYVMMNIIILHFLLINVRKIKLRRIEMGGICGTHGSKTLRIQTTWEIHAYMGT
jgi:hypothetical protein